MHRPAGAPAAIESTGHSAPLRGSSSLASTAAAVRKMTQPATIPFAAPAGEPAPDAPTIARGASGRAGDRILRWSTLLSALLVLALLVGLVGVLTVSAIPSVRTFGWRFLIARDWRPNPLEVPKRDAAGNV